MSRSLLLIAPLALALAFVGSASATTTLVYTNDSGSSSGAAWNGETVTLAPIGEHFLGILENPQVVVLLTGLPPPSPASRRTPAPSRTTRSTAQAGHPHRTPRVGYSDLPGLPLK